MYAVVHSCKQGLVYSSCDLSQPKPDFLGSAWENPGVLLKLGELREHR